MPGRDGDTVYGKDEGASCGAVDANDRHDHDVYTGMRAPAGKRLASIP
jgi:hypothetical protein